MSLISKPTKGIAVALTAALLSTTAASASTLQIGNIAASWLNPVGGSAVSINNVAPLNPTISWGIPTTNAGKSGYQLQVLSDPVPNPAAAADTNFDVADFTHINQPIQSGTSITAVGLQIVADILINGATAVTGATFSFLFNHNETPNIANQCPTPPQTGPGACADIVTISLLDDTSTFDFGGVDYTLSIMGFMQGGIMTDKFISVEGGSSTGQLVARFTAAPAPVPLPAAGWMLIAGVGGLAALRRRQKRAAA